MNNLIIVESENDKFFIESFVEQLNLSSIEVGQPICQINDFNCLSGFTNLESRLKSIKIDRYEQIGIIIDADEVGIIERIKFINDALKSICSDIYLTKINTLEQSKELDLSIACYITNINGKGELETVMRQVKSEESIYADCLNAWKQCIEKNGKKINQKEFDKIWVSHYLKYDTCLGKDKKQKYKKCANELISNSNNLEDIENNLQSNNYTIAKQIWNFEHNTLIDLKNFLLLFK